MASFCCASVRARPAASSPWAACARPRAPMIIGVTMAMSVLAEASLTPRNLERVDVNIGRAAPPSSVDSMPLPLSASCGVRSASPPVRDRNMSGDCCAIAEANWRAPSGFSATPAKPVRMAGTAAATPSCASLPSRPDAAASLPMSSGVKNRDIAATMVSVMANHLSVAGKEAVTTERRRTSGKTRDCGPG